MRKATLAALLLGASALLRIPTVVELRLAQELLAIVAFVAAFWFISRDPIMADARQRRLLYVALGVVLAMWILPGLLQGLGPLLVIALRNPAMVAVIALPLWLLASRLEQTVFILAAAAALAEVVLRLANMGADISYFGPLGAALGALMVAWRLHGGQPAQAKRPPQVVMAWNPPSLSPSERKKRLAELEKRFRAGEMPEHEYLDRRQELEH